MILTELALRDFRNYENLQLHLHPSLTVITGNNGSGKTNLLESLLVISTTKSFRCRNDEEMIRKGCESARIEASSMEDCYRIVLQKKGKTLFINNNPIKRSSDYLGKVNAILFKPDDLFTFDASPAHRRSLMDIELSKSDPTYLKTLLAYNRLLNDKNVLLKEEKINFDYLDVLDEAMIPYLKEIISKRRQFITYMEEETSKIFRQLSALSIPLTIEYKNCCIEDSIALKEALLKSRDRDLFLKYACFGIQKEDMLFKLNGYPISSYASQGQKRMVMISFKLALVSYLKMMNDDYPIVLLDDLLSELDDENIQRLFTLLPKEAQTILTGTSVPDLLKQSSYTHIQIKEGVLYGTD